MQWYAVFVSRYRHSILENSWCKLISTEIFTGLVDLITFYWKKKKGTHKHTTQTHTRCSGMSPGAVCPKIRMMRTSMKTSCLANHCCDIQLRLDRRAPVFSERLCSTRVLREESLSFEMLKWLKMAFPFYLAPTAFFMFTRGHSAGTLPDIKRSSVFSHIVKVLNDLFVITT